MAIRTIFKRIGAAVLGAGSSLVIAACYGAYYTGDYMRLVSGRVTTTDGTGIPELQVCADVGYGTYCDVTEPDGGFYIEAMDSVVDDANSGGFTVQVRDVDGPANGTFEDKDVTVDPGQAPADLTITVDGTGL